MLDQACKRVQTASQMLEHYAKNQTVNNRHSSGTELMA